MVVVGLAEKDVRIGAFSLTARQRGLAGSQVGGIHEIQDIPDFCSRHGVACDVEVVPIQKVNEAYERALKSDVRYRFVIDMASLAKD
jgi:uncharacterized zinc-type alcohol dehydrogenase-like protein